VATACGGLHYSTGLEEGESGEILILSSEEKRPPVAPGSGKTVTLNSATPTTLATATADDAKTIDTSNDAHAALEARSFLASGATPPDGGGGGGGDTIGTTRARNQAGGAQENRDEIRRKATGASLPLAASANHGRDASEARRIGNWAGEARTGGGGGVGRGGAGGKPSLGDIEAKVKTLPSPRRKVPAYLSDSPGGFGAASRWGALSKAHLQFHRLGTAGETGGQGTDSLLPGIKFRAGVGLEYPPSRLGSLISAR